MADKEKELGAVADLGCVLHTALRKCCDSTQTSLAYNLISMDAFSEEGRASNNTQTASGTYRGDSLNTPFNN